MIKNYYLAKTVDNWDYLLREDWCYKLMEKCKLLEAFVKKEYESDPNSFQLLVCGNAANTITSFYCYDNYDIIHKPFRDLDYLLVSTEYANPIKTAYPLIIEPCVRLNDELPMDCLNQKVLRILDGDLYHSSDSSYNECLVDIINHNIYVTNGYNATKGFGMIYPPNWYGGKYNIKSFLAGRVDNLFRIFDRVVSKPEENNCLSLSTVDYLNDLLSYTMDIDPNGIVKAYRVFYNWVEYKKEIEKYREIILQYPFNKKWIWLLDEILKGKDGMSLSEQIDSVVSYQYKSVTSGA